MSGIQSEHKTVKAGEFVGDRESATDSSQSSTSTIRLEDMADSDSDEAEISGLPTSSSHDLLAFAGFGSTRHANYDDPRSSMYSIDAFLPSHTVQKETLPVEISGAHMDDEGYEGDEEFDESEPQADLSTSGITITLEDSAAIGSSDSQNHDNLL